jgi:Domain of unknown function (DUF4159)
MARRLRPLCRRSILFIACAGLLACAALPTAALGATPEEIDAAIEKGVKFLYSTQDPKTGTWERVPQRRDGLAGDSVDGAQWGGRTALATYALLASGQSPGDPRLQKSIAFLRQADLVGFYAIPFRAMCWLYLPRTSENLQAVQRDFKLLWGGIEKDMTKLDGGLYDYTFNDRIDMDLSTSHLGVLGMWACAEMGMEVPAGDPRKKEPNYWWMVDERWKKLQDPKGGGWSYEGEPSRLDDTNPYTSHNYSVAMTAGGVATLFITQDFLQSRQGVACNGNQRNPHIDLGIGYLERRFDEMLKVESFNKLYALYGLERAGVASGLKYLGKRDWYKEGAAWIVRNQAANGSWDGRGGPEPSTAFAILFLSRGREPVMMNKLQYQLVRPRGETVEGFWNQRPRDAANAARYVARQTERPVNWQLLDLSIATVDDLHDAPLAYISGAQALTLDEAHVAKLKQYVEEGGTLVFNTDCGRRPFSQSVQKLWKQMFPNYEPRSLARNSVVLDNQQFRATAWRQQPDINALSNGARELAFMLDDDIGKSLQTNETTVRTDHFGAMTNIYQYAIDKTAARVKGRSHVVRPDDTVKTTGSVKVARLMYKGNADPEPGGWRRLAAILRNQHQLDVTVSPVQLGVDPLDGFAVAHLTGTDPMTFTPEQVASLKAFVDKGGLLLIDAAGGSVPFASSVAPQLQKIFAAANADGGERVPATDALVKSGKPLKVEYRVYRKAVGEESNQLALRGIKNPQGRWTVLFSADDLSVGMVGNAIDGIRGYTPETATELMTRVVVYAASHKP